MNVAQQDSTSCGTHILVDAGQIRNHKENFPLPCQLGLQYSSRAAIDRIETEQGRGTIYKFRAKKGKATSGKAAKRVKGVKKTEHYALARYFVAPFYTFKVSGRDQEVFFSFLYFERQMFVYGACLFAPILLCVVSTFLLIGL